MAAVIDFRATAAAALVIESRVARVLAKIELGDFAEADADVDDLRFMAFADGVSCLVREGAKDAAVALTAELNVRRSQAAI